MQPIRPPAVAGTWYPGSAAALAAAVDGYLSHVRVEERLHSVTAIVVPHAGLMYSGPVAAHAYRQLQGRPIDVVVMVGPSHSVGFDGVAICRHGGFDSPLGVASIDEACATRLLETSPLIFEHPAAHAREHSLEMQLPFIRRVLPHARIVPLLMGWQSRAVAAELGRTLGVALQGAAVVLVASTDLSHYHDAGTARVLDARVMAQVERFSPDGLQTLLDENPDHACGGGPTVAVMRAAQALGARDALILNYADSGDVSGDKSAVVGYLAAVLGSRHADSTGRT